MSFSCSLAIIIIIHFIIPFGKFGLPIYLGKATEAASAVLPSPTSACWGFSCFSNPPNSDMDYKIFNVHTWSSLWVHIYIHTRVGHIDNESAQHFWLRKTHKFFLCSWRGLNLGSLDLLSDAPPIEPPRHHNTRYQYYQKCMHGIWRAGWAKLQV